MASCMTLKRSFDHDRDSNTNSTPYESRTPSSKRQRRCFPMTVVSSTNETTTEISFGNQSVFPDVQPILTADILLTRIKEEVRRLQRRHQLKPSSSDLPDDDNHHTTDSTSLSNLPGHSSSNSQHLLTLKQVNMICARLLKEREEKIREEYDQILSNKLNEQYEGFVRFTQDQLTRRFSELQFSYVS
ncbi:unnamed protein product [Rotaria sordida]|uniref:Akirin n=1 Tax=Rotaria sordida TaxID=392033 RepID=A0A814MCL9_9BILA|nr:unnamed protein product [Rotaria sordida]CAF1077109.1 unnamed protein product [Rotaria sordida]CAF1265708.1 unnamed protein product [Rotaria sordida]CAF1293615.1 unnamed protein product [Rotaria sordida]CAF3663628.1 unnamed protein product [Rotaria sordida]